MIAASHKSITEAAASLNLPPATLSKRIGDLETQLSAQLFVRSATGIALTDAGQKILGDVQAMDRMASSIAKTLRDLDRQTRDPNALFDLDAEQALIGAILFDNETYNRITPRLQHTHFYDPVHARLFQACSQMISAGDLVDGITLKERFARDGGIKEIGGAVYLLKLMESAAPLSSEAQIHADRVYDLGRRREFVRLAQLIVTTASEQSQDISIAEQAIRNLAKSASILSLDLNSRLSSKAVDAAIGETSDHGNTGENFRQQLRALSDELTLHVQGPHLSPAEIMDLKKELLDESE